MNKNNEKTNIKRVFGAKHLTVIIAIVLVLAAAVGITTALLIWRSDKQTSVFKPASSACSVIEDNGSFRVRNNGDTEMYVRAMINVTWKNDDGEVYAKIQPSEGTDYEIELNTIGWFRGNDGYYYCKSPIGIGKDTEALITAYEAVSAVTADSDAFPNGYTLSVEMIAQTIQSEPAEAVKDYWNVKVDGDGYLGK